MCWQKKQLFPQKKWLKRWLVGFCGMCCFVGGVSSFFVRGEKKQNKLPSVSSQARFPSNCTALSTEYQSNHSVFCNYFNLLLSYKCVELVVLHTCLQRWRYETFGRAGCVLIHRCKKLMRGRMLK